MEDLVSQLLANHQLLWQNSCQKDFLCYILSNGNNVEKFSTVIKTNNFEHKAKSSKKGKSTYFSPVDWDASYRGFHPSLRMNILFYNSIVLKSE